MRENIKRDSAEYHTDQYLMNTMKSQDADTFPFVLPPITILYPPYDFMFMISPLWVIKLIFLKCTLTLGGWGDGCGPECFTNVRQILQC